MNNNGGFNGKINYSIINGGFSIAILYLITRGYALGFLPIGQIWPDIGR
jgi:hypothetical protein